MSQKKRRRTRKIKVPRPVSRVDLSEDTRGRVPHSRFGLEGNAQRVPAPRVHVAPDAAIPRSEVERRVLRAMRTVRALPDRERRFAGYKQASPDYIQDYIDAYDSAPLHARFQPDPADISDCLTALSWARHLQRPEWRLLWLRSLEYSFGLIGEYIGRSDETVRRRYGDVLTDVWCAANNIQPRAANRWALREAQHA